MKKLLLTAMALMLALCGCSADKAAKVKLTTDKDLAQYLVRAKSSEYGLYGYVDVRSGEYVIDPQFDKADSMFGNDGWAEVKIGDDTTFINTKGEQLFELGTIDRCQEYADECIVVLDVDSNVSLYHGGAFVKRLQCPLDVYDVWRPELALRITPEEMSYYAPEKYFAMWAIDENKQRRYYWYDKEGDLICEMDDQGALAGDDNGYYFFAEEYVLIMDKEGNVLERKEIGGNLSKITYTDGNFYVAKGNCVYTNGLTELMQISKSDIVMATNNVIAIRGNNSSDVRYAKPDGEVFYNSRVFARIPNKPLSWGWYSFENGYAMVSGGPGNFCGYIDRDGNEELKLEYDELAWHSEVLPGGYIIYGDKSLNLWGVKDISGNVIVEPTYAAMGDKP